DNCQVDTVIASPASGSTFAVGTTPVTVTATDIHGNVQTATFNVTVNDDQKPVITVPADMTVVAAAGICSSNVTFNVSATDNCQVDTVIASPASGSSFAVGTTPVTVTATDIHGNVQTATFNVTVNDDQKPVITVPSDITVVAAAGICSSNVTFNVSATDNCQVDTVIASPASGSSFAVGTTPVTVTATDIHGNVQTATFNVTVNDDQKPVITVPSDITVVAAAGICSSNVTFNVSATDNCQVDTVIASPASGSSFAVGTTPVTVTATDIHGNVQTATFNVTVNDDQKPVITVPSDITVVAAAGICSSNVTFNVSATDNCQVDTVIASPASGSSFAVGTTPVTVTATDIHGNVQTATFNVTVNDDQKPVITVPSDITVVAAAGICSSNVTFNVSATDNCQVDTVIASPASGSTFAVGTTPVTVTATDIHGNVQTVTVNDDQKPVITVPSDITVVAAAGICSSNVTFNVSATDNCQVDTVIASPA